MGGETIKSPSRFTDLRLRLELVEGAVSVALLPVTGTSEPIRGVVPLHSFTPLQNLRDALWIRGREARQLAQIGQELGKLAFPDAIRRNVLDQASRNPVRIRISADEALSRIPWELSVVEEIGSSNSGYLALCARISITRDVGNQDIPLTPPSERPSVLVAWANPGSARYPLLHFADREADSVIRALKSAECSAVKVDELPYATISSLIRCLAERKPDILHFIGHGDIHPTGGVIVLEGGMPSTEALLYAEDLAKAVVDAGTRMVVLSGCITGGAPEAIGTKLAELGVPAVLAMSMPIQDAAAHQFSRALYSSLAEGTQLDEAVFEGRCAIAGMGCDWSAPQLMLNVSQPIIISEHEESSFRWKTAERKTNLSYDDRPFIGRVKERSDLRRKIRDQGQRLVTITGPGGMGKTRLSKQVAAELREEFPDGVWFVDCESLIGDQELITGIAGSIPFANQSESRQGLKDALSRRRLLLVLDCFENSIAQGALLDELLTYATGLHLLLTSRILLGLPREHEYPLQPMSLTAKAGETADGITLFAEAAGHAIDGFAVTVKNRKLLRELCASLEGVPLAIVLAAGRLRHMGLPELIQQVREQPIATLRRRSGGIDRHANIESVVAGSFNLLPTAERHMLCKIGLFVGTFSLADANFVCAVPETEIVAWLSDLRDHSLVQILRNDVQTRYKLLDTVRDYLSRLVVDEGLQRELALCRLRHAEYYTRLAETVGRLMSEGRWSAGTNAMMQDIGNIRAAIDTAVSLQRDDLIAAMTTSVARRFFEAGLLTDYRKLADAGYWAAERLRAPSLRIKLLGLDGALASRNGDEQLCEKLWLERVALARQIGDIEQCADTLIDLAWQAFELHDPKKSRLRLIEALRLARNVNDPTFIATARVVQARLALASDDKRLAVHRAEQAEKLLLQCADRNGALFLYQNLSIASRELGDVQKSVQYLLDLMRLSIERNQVMHAAWALLELAPMFEETNRVLMAGRCYLAAMKVHAEYASRLRARANTAYSQFKKRYQDDEVTSLLTSLRNNSWQEIIAELAGG